MVSRNSHGFHWPHHHKLLSGHIYKRMTELPPLCNQSSLKSLKRSFRDRHQKQHKSELCQCGCHGRMFCEEGHGIDKHGPWVTTVSFGSINDPNGKATCMAFQLDLNVNYFISTICIITKICRWWANTIW